MIEKYINSRLISKHDTEENWSNLTDFKPKKGEVIIYDKDETHDYERMKIGDGETLITDLPFLLESELAAIYEQLNKNDLQVSETQPSFACTWFRVKPSVVTFTVTYTDSGNVYNSEHSVAYGTTWREWAETTYDDNYGDYVWKAYNNYIELDPLGYTFSVNPDDIIVSGVYEAV